ncbi:MAG: gluconate 2-dehydrogenase subunit 3 family protein [Acidobacteriota bacterium]
MADTTKKKDTDVSRREMLKLGAGAAIGAPLVKIEQSPKRAPAPKPIARFFTPAEFALVDELSEMIIPADDHSPGARAARVAEYIDQRLLEAFEDDPRQQWRDGLKVVDQLAVEMNGKTFLKASPAQRLAVLTRMSQNEADPKKPEELFFRELKSRTARGYYTSKIGILTEMEYKGNTYLREFAGEDANPGG